MTSRHLTAVFLSSVFMSLLVATESQLEETLIKIGMTAATNVLKELTEDMDLPDFTLNIGGSDTQILDKVNAELEKINTALLQLKLTVEIQAYSTFISNIYRAIKKTTTALRNYSQNKDQTRKDAFFTSYVKQDIEDKLDDLIDAAKDSSYVTTQGLGTVPAAYAQALGCDVKPFETFIEHYLKLIRDAIFLRNVYTALKFGSGGEFVLTDVESKAVSDAFDNELQKCRAQHPSSGPSMTLRGVESKVLLLVSYVAAAMLTQKLGYF